MSAEVLTDSSGWDDCKHGLPALTCAACRNPYRPPGPPTIEHMFNARFAGHCSGCNLPVVVGQRIARMSDETYLHDWCTA